MAWNSTRVVGDQGGQISTVNRHCLECFTTCSSRWLAISVWIGKKGCSNLEDGDFQSSHFQNYLCITIPFLPAISEDFVFDDLPAIAKNSDLVAASPTPIFWVGFNLGWTSHTFFQHDFWGSNLSSSTSHKSYRPLTTFSFWIQVFINTSWSQRVVI